MGNLSSKAGDADRGDKVTQRAVGITGGGPLKRIAAPKTPANAVRTKADDYTFIEVGPGAGFIAQREIAAGGLIYDQVVSALLPVSRAIKYQWVAPGLCFSHNTPSITQQRVSCRGVAVDKICSMKI
jgi:hypothetical protein